MPLPPTLRADRSNLYAGICGAVCLGLSVALAAFPCRLMAEDTIPLEAVTRANAVIDEVMEAYGGAERIDGLNSVARWSTFTTWATNQSRRPGPPWDEGHQDNFAAIDFATRTFVGRQQGSTGGFDFSNEQIVKGEEAGWNIDHRGRIMVAAANPNFDNNAGPFIRVTVPLLVKQLGERRHTSHWLGEADFQGRPHDIITLVMEVGPALSLYVDRETHLVSRAERVLPPFGQVDYRFSDYREVDGIPFAHQFALYANDQPNLVIDYEKIEVNQPIEAYAALPEGYETVQAPNPSPEVQLEEIAEGVFLAGAGGAYGLFVDMGDEVVAVGATAGAGERIARLREAGVEQPIKQAVLTHHHNDHLAGVKAFETEGATLYTVAENEAVVRSSAVDGDALDLAFVDGRRLIESGGRRLEIIDIGPTAHVEHLLVAWLPEEGVLFEADHFPNPAHGVILPAQPMTVRLAEVIDALGLDVKLIVGAHSPRVASMDDLRASLRKATTLETAGL